MLRLEGESNSNSNSNSSNPRIRFADACPFLKGWDELKPQGLRR
ncbi:hypothetical protein [Lysobacter gummosus]